MKTKIPVLSLRWSCRCVCLVVASVLSLLVSTPAEAAKCYGTAPKYCVQETSTTVSNGGIANVPVRVTLIGQVVSGSVAGASLTQTGMATDRKGNPVTVTFDLDSILPNWKFTTPTLRFPVTITARYQAAGGVDIPGLTYALIGSDNSPPTSTSSIPDRKVLAGGSIPPIVLSDYFSDADIDDTLTYSVVSAVASSGTAATHSIRSGVLFLTGQEVGTTTVTVKAADAAGPTTTGPRRGREVEQSFTLTVVSADNMRPAAVANGIPPVVLTAGGEKTIDISGAFTDTDAGDTLTYSVVSANPIGFASARIVGANGQVIVEPAGAGSGTITVGATDGILRSGSEGDDAPVTPQTFMVTINAAPELIAVADQTYSINTAITPLTLPEATLGTGAFTYVLTGPNAGPLLAGLTFDAGSRVLSGTPTTTTAAPTTLTYTATDVNGVTATQTFDVSVPLTAPSISANPAVVTVTVSTPITPITIISSGGLVASYAILPAIDNGLAFDTVTGTISGTPTAVATVATYTITATNAIGPGTTTVAITVSAAPNMPATGVPTITGDPTTGSVLTADISEISDANGMPTTFTYQWLADDVNIAAAATASTFTLTEAQDEDGTEITVKVSFTDNDGYLEELVSAPLRVTNITVQNTVDITNRFLGARTDLILANLPRATRRITRLQRGSGPELLVAVQDLTGALAAVMPFDFDFFSLGSGSVAVATSLEQVTRAADSLQAQTGSLDTAEHTRSKFDVWFEGSLHDFSGSGDSGGTFGIAHLGADYLFSPDLLIGAQVQYDSLSESSRSETYKIEGQGWMVGPYATVRLFDNLLYLDGHVAWGMSDNEISPARTYTDDFTTERWLTDISLTGNFTQGNWRIRPNISLSYLEETQESYVSSSGATIVPEQTVSRGHVSLGPTVSIRLSGPYGMVLEPSLNLDVIYSHAETRGVTPTRSSPAGDGWRARAEPGLTITTPEGLRLGITATYDGIGQSEFEAWSVGVKGGFKF